MRENRFVSPHLPHLLPIFPTICQRWYMTSLWLGITAATTLAIQLLDGLAGAQIAAVGFAMVCLLFSITILRPFNKV